MIVEAHAALELLQSTRTALDPTSITIERFDTAETVPLRSVFWIRGVDGDDIGAALARDDTVADHRRLSTDTDALLFRAYHPENKAITDIYHRAVDNEVVLIDATAEGEAWSFTLWLPDRECLSSFRDECADAGVPVSIHSMYNDEPQPMGDVYGMTKYQREILQLAVRNGYFTIPREVTLSELAAKLDLSSQAASERLRRGIRTLAQTALNERYLEDSDSH